VDGLVRVRSLNGFDACVLALGGDPKAILQRVGVDAKTLADPDAWMPFSVTLRAFEIASEVLADPAFGVKLSRSRDLSYLGPVFLVARHAPDVEQALTSMSRFFPVQNTAVHTMMHVHDDRILRTYHMSRNLRRHGDQWIEESLATFGVLLESFAGDRVQISRVLMRHKPNRALWQYAEQYGADVLFDQPVDGIELRRDVLERTVPNHDLGVYRFLSEHLEALVASSGKDIEAAIRHLLETLIPMNQGRIDVVSRHLGMHPRTLQRHLGKQGYTFSELLEEQKRVIAERMLLKGDRSLIEIAAHLGYAEQSAFNHAFSRWHGRSPSQWLREQRTPGA